MALLVPSLVALLPMDLAEWIDARAATEGITTEALVLLMLRDYMRIVDAANAGSGEPVAVYQPAIQMPVWQPPPPLEHVCPANPTRRAALLAVVDSLGPIRTGDVWSALALRGQRMSYTLTCESLSWLVQHGDLRRVRHGVYEMNVIA